MITQNICTLLSEIPEYVTLVAAVKSRSETEIIEAIDAGINVLGENYTQEAVVMHSKIEKPVKWHMIGALQTNKAKIIANTFDMVESLNSIKMADALNKQCQKINKIMPVLLEINSGREKQKNGFFPEDVLGAINQLNDFTNLKIQGLMTMGPVSGTETEIRPYFRATKELFDDIKKENISGVEMKYLSMGMTNSYRVGIEEGANIVRIGSKIFGPRNYSK